MNNLTAILVTCVILLAVLIVWGIRERRCPKCGAYMKTIRTIRHHVQIDHPQYKSWCETTGVPPEDIYVLKCKKCDFTKELRESVHDPTTG